MASARSEGRTVEYLGKPFTVRTLTEDSFAGVDIALFSAGGQRSREFAPAAVEAGAVVIDNSSAFRMAPNVPLVVPEVNEAAIQAHEGIIANPNCVAAPLVVVLKPLADAVGLERVIISSYQAVSGTGAGGIAELRRETEGYLAGDEPEPQVYPHPIAFNVLPHIDTLRRDRLHRRGAQGHRRDPEDARVARPARQRDVRARARCSTDTRCRSRSRRPSRSTPTRPGAC